MLLSTSAFAAPSSDGSSNETSILIEGLSIAIDPTNEEDSFTKTCYLIEDKVLEDGTVVMQCSDIAPRYNYTLNLTLFINKVSPSIYSVKAEAYTGSALLLIKSFTAVLDYGNGDRIQGLGVNQAPMINGCSTVSTITYPNRVYTPGTYVLEITSYRLVVCEYINTNNTEQAGL